MEQIQEPKKPGRLKRALRATGRGAKAVGRTIKKYPGATIGAAYCSVGMALDTYITLTHTTLPWLFEKPTPTMNEIANHYNWADSGFGCNLVHSTFTYARRVGECCEAIIRYYDFHIPDYLPAFTGIALLLSVGAVVGGVGGNLIQKGIKKGARGIRRLRGKESKLELE